MTATASTQAALDRLADELGPDRVLRDSGARERFKDDMLRGGRGGGEPHGVLPAAVLRPQSTTEVVACVRAAASAGMALVEYGGGTGLMGGARSVEGGLMLDLGAMNRVLEVRLEDLAVHVEAGAVLEDVGDELEPFGLILGHDPWTYPIATVGGTISTNGLGYLGGKYGSMGEQVLGLTVVLAGGEVLRTRAVPKSSTGPALNPLFIGAEGTLGIITEAVLRAFPRPEQRLLRGFTFPGFDEGWRAVQAMAALGLRPAMVDFGQTYRGPRDGAGLVAPDGAPGLLYLAFDGLKEEVRALSRRAAAVATAHAGKRLPRADAQEFWDERHVIAEQIRARRASGAGVFQPDTFPQTLFDYIHVAVPASKLLEYKRACSELFPAHGVSIAEWGLWHRPEFFSVALFRTATRRADIDDFTAAVDEALRLVQDLGGSMEYVHGAGLRLAGLMAREHGSGFQLMKALKAALDPDHLMNPGKLGL